MKQGEIITALLEVIKTQQASIDKVLTHHYDRPIERTVHPQPNNQMPLFAMGDQGDGAEDIADIQEKQRIAVGIANLHAESDEAFLNSIQ